MSHTPRFHRLTVNDLRRESADAVSLTFAIPETLADDYRFAPGQYLTLRTTMDGEEVRRSYSICSGPDDGELRIAVKKVDGGAFSSWAADELKTGDELDVMTPTGRFGVAHAPDEARVYAGFAAGSGITPILSIVKGVLAREPNSRFFLFYGNRSTGGMLFREALEELKDRFIERLSVFPVIDGKRREVPVAEGEAILDAALRAGMDLPFACKGGMCSTCRAKLVEGAAQMEVNYSLEPWELEKGFILTCQARPTTDKVVVDYDHV